MAAYYTYLISGLPMLNFGMKPPFSFDGFIERCQGLIPDAETDMLKAALKLTYEDGQPTLKKWRTFDKDLRNELVKLRAARKHVDPVKYLRKDGFVEPYITHIAMGAVRNTSILEGEKMLDEGRWSALEELSVGHFFDIDFLIIYAQKLLILECREKIRAADKAQLLKEALSESP